MNQFLKMMERTQSSPYYDHMVRFARPLYDHLGINHFWYYRITRNGSYIYVGTHGSWNEYCFGESLHTHFPCLRFTNATKGGISLMKADNTGAYQNVLKTAKEKFQINFHLNLFETCSEGVEAFGFASRFSDHEADDRLLNELPLLRYFINEFRKNHGKLFSLLQENAVDLSAHMGNDYYEKPKGIVLPFERSKFLEAIGCNSFSCLTPREKDIMRLLANGFPASYIKEQLHLGVRTVENYIANIKDKLSCNSKVELIKKAQEALFAGLI